MSVEPTLVCGANYSAFPIEIRAGGILLPQPPGPNAVRPATQRGVPGEAAAAVGDHSIALAA